MSARTFLGGRLRVVPAEDDLRAQRLERARHNSHWSERQPADLDAGRYGTVVERETGLTLMPFRANPWANEINPLVFVLNDDGTLTFYEPRT